MANKTLFATNKKTRSATRADTVNAAGGVAYSFTDQHQLAQYACTGVFNNTFYTDAGEQLDKVLELLPNVDPEFIAKTAVYARKRGFMKDVPAFLLAYLSCGGDDEKLLLRQAFDSVINNGKMVRNFVQFIRSGVLSRKSLGSLPKKLVQGWLESRSDDQLFKDSVGNEPSMADIIKMVHPKPQGRNRESLYAYLLGKNESKHQRYLPALVKAYEKFKADPQEADVPDVPFQMLTSFDVPKSVWKEIAKNAGWHMTRMNLNTFARHDVFSDKKIVKMIAERLKDEEEIRKAKAFPYQLFAAYSNIGGDVPHEIRESLQDAMEIAIDNVPEVKGNVFVFPDVSGSMQSSVTGNRKGSTSSVRCIDVAALVAASVLRKNPSAKVMPFEHDVVNMRLNSRDSVMSNAEKLASIGGGGTNCSAPMEKIYRDKEDVDLVIYVSDNESWVDSSGYIRGTRTLQVWNEIKRRCPKAKMVCIDVTPNTTTQARDQDDILNIGGFSDSVFDVIGAFVEGKKDHWVDVINKQKI
jgi:60 kDa SS-A/Ro ribonucleoprotein